MSEPSHVEADIGWAVVGLGRAGQARVRDLDSLPGHRLVAAVGAREGEAAIRAAIADDATDAVIVCSDNASHARWVRAALEADRHVVCEFPLAEDAETARALYALASERRRVLHVELIGLLTESHRGWFARRERIASITIDFAGGRYRWVDDALRAGLLGTLAVGRLHALWSLCGPLELVAARHDERDGVSQLDVELRGSAGQRLALRDARGPALQRRASWEVREASGAAVEPVPVPPLGAGLFASDLLAAGERIRTADRAGRYVEDDIVVEVLALADAINRRLRG